MLIEGTVFRGSSGTYFVRRTPSGSGALSEQPQDYAVKLRGNLKKEIVLTTSGSRPQRATQVKKRRSTDPIAVGDRVLFDPDRAIIQEILPRHSELARLSPVTREQHVLVANIDTVFIVFAAAHPAPDLRLLDRFLVLAEAAEIGAQIVVNKCDLAASEIALHSFFSPYAKAGYPIHYTCAKKRWGMEELRQALAGKISALAGPSGVGKSSLLNTLQPGLTLKTGEVGAVRGRGRHTTTTAELIPLDDKSNSWIADTPGFQNIEFWDVPVEDIVHYFPEFAPYYGACQFADCRHFTEPGCAVRAAVERGELAASRYQSYLDFAG